MRYVDVPTKDMYLQMVLPAIIFACVLMIIIILQYPEVRINHLFYFLLMELLMFGFLSLAYHMYKWQHAEVVNLDTRRAD